MKTIALLLAMLAVAPAAHAINCVGDEACMEEFQARLQQASKGAVTGERDIFAKCGDVDHPLKDGEDALALVSQCLDKSYGSYSPYAYGVEKTDAGLTVFVTGDDSDEAAEAVTELNLSLVKHPKLFGVPVEAQDRRKSR